MNRPVAQSSVRGLARSRLRLKARSLRPIFESLEGRLMLDAGGSSGLPASIIVGRTLATPSTAATSTPSPSYFLGEVQNNQVTITYTVYNEQADPETGVLLTDTLDPGVTISSATQQPDQSGQHLDWSLGTIQGYDRASVSLTVDLPNPVSSQIDSGAQAFAMLDAGAVSASTPAAELKPGNVTDPNLLASTPDASTTDPFIQEEAAALGYDAQNIFNFLHTQLTYNSYLGSVRGARGTLWSNAGNALDVASLGVALMRASGIPAQYVSGTLSQSDAQELILSMFPAQYQTVGYIPAGTQTSDPANDPQLLSETESHYWFQFDTGSGMKDADPLMAGATVGQNFTASTGTFTEVPDALREKTEVQLVAEIDNSAEAAFGLNPLQNTTVLDQTFNDVDLVGRPVSIGNFVSQSGSSALITAVTNTYTPYIDVGDDANLDPSQDEVITGKPYQEVLTNFPLSSQILTGLFLDITLSGPQGPSEAFQQTLFDRIGFTARQSGEPVNPAVSPDGTPALSPFDLETISISAAQRPAAVIAGQMAELQGINNQQQQLAPLLQGLDPGSLTQSQQVIVQHESTLIQENLTVVARLLADSFTSRTDQLTREFMNVEDVIAYFDRPRITVVSSGIAAGTAGSGGTVSLAMNLMKDDIRPIAMPGQAAAATFAFNFTRGISESTVEQYTLSSSSIQLDPGTTQIVTPVGAPAIFQAASSQGVPLVFLTNSDTSELDGLAIPADAKGRITQELAQGFVVVVPGTTVQLDGAPQIAWFDLDPVTGRIVDESQDGEHQSFIEFAGVTVLGLFLVGTIGVVGADLFDHFSTGTGWELIKRSNAGVVQELKQQAENTSNSIIARLGYLIEFSLFVIPTEIIAVIDPPLDGMIHDTSVPALDPPNRAQEAAAITTSIPAATVSGSVRAVGLQISNDVRASWTSNTTSSALATSLIASATTVTKGAGDPVGTGQVSLSVKGLVPLTLSGNLTYQVNGEGSLSFYGPAGSSLGASGDWQNYTATVTGDDSITLTVPAGALTLAGEPLPAGTYTIMTDSATFSGSGTTSSPNFAGTAMVTTSSGTLDLGPGSGALSVGRKSLDPDDETTLDGYNGTITVSANGDGTDSISLNGNAGNVLQVTTTPQSLTTHQNTQVTFAANVQTSLADTYTLTANAPAGWTVSIDSSGNVTATPPAGLQGGTYPIQVIAQSQTDSNLEAQTTVDVTINPTQPGLNLAVNSDPLFTVPFNGAQLPTAFRATIQNLGPAADTYNLTFSNLPSGFSLLNSGTSVTVAAGDTGILGIYLQPNAGQPIPPVGAQLSFTVTATSTTDPAITQTFTETFTVPAIDAVTVTANPTAVNTIPGAPITDTLTFTNVGNVDENNVTLSDTLPSDLTLDGLAPVSLAVGQSTTETITLTPNASTPLNSMLEATITATYGPAASPQTQTVDIPIQVEVPGASAIATASVAAGQLGNTSLADRLNDLSTALTNLVQNPTSAVYQSQAQASLAAAIGSLGADPYLSTLIPALNSDAAALAGAATAAAVQTAASNLGNDLETVGTTLADEAAHGFTLSLLNNSRVGQPQAPTLYQVKLQNTGTQPTTYDLSIAGLPSGVTGTFDQPSITLAPGQSTLVASGTSVVNASITSTSTAQLPSFSFSIIATAEGAPEITQSSVAQLAARAASVEVISVSTNPPFTNPGGQVDVSAEILDAVNRQQQAQVSYTVTDPNGNVVFTSQPVSTTLNVLSTLSSVDLGNFDTTSLADGEYTINVAIDDASGNPIPGATGHGTLLVGTPVTAQLSTTPLTLPAGNAAVTSTLQINASGDSGATTAEFTVPGASDPYLAGMPAGSTASEGDVAPAESPVQVVGLPIIPGSQLTFSASGSVNFGQGAGPPQGLLDFFTSHAGGAENGISGITCPVDALLGVFLGPDQPSNSPAPTNLDYFLLDNVPGGVNYTSLAPDLQQLFYMGTGVNSSGVTQTITVPAGATRFFLATMDGEGWYNNSGSFQVQVQVNLPESSAVSIDAQVTVPTNNGVSIDTSSFNIAPSSITTNTNNTETLEWDSSLPSGTLSQTITWQSDVSGLQPGQSLPVIQGATVNFVSQGEPGSLNFPAQFVTGEQIIGINPTTQTVPPAAPASFDVKLLNPTDESATYDLSVQGVPSSWVSLPTSVTVAPNASVDVPLMLTSDAFAAPADYGFTVTANGNNGAAARVSGDLVLAGQPAPPDATAHAVVASLTPGDVTTGQGAPARYIVQLTNTGSADDTFSLAVSGLPTGVAWSLGQTTLDVPPGTTNFRDISLLITPQNGTAAGQFPFTVTATSTSNPTVRATTSGLITVVAGGVMVTLNPPSEAPGSQFQATIKNTGTTTDTYKLTLAGPAALVASLATAQLTLAPGASQNVSITTGTVDFAVQGSLPLTAAATSTTNPAIQGTATSNLTIAASHGMTAGFSPSTETLAAPGMATFLLTVHNTGNAEDSYSATIIGENGPVTATLVGLDGSPAQSIPTFFLPGLSTGEIEVEANAAEVGQGAFTVLVQSLSTSSISSSATATVVVTPQMPHMNPTPVTADGPQVTEVQRFGYHMMPTTLVLTFDQALDPVTAQDPRNYRIVGPRGRIIHVKRAIYDPSADIVILHPRERINIHYRYTLIVDGSRAGGLSNTRGVLLDGSRSGAPGTDLRAPITWRNVVKGASTPSKSRHVERMKTNHTLASNTRFIGV